jgi:hypothetical protein
VAKQGGLGARFLVAGYDISGDISALDSISAKTNLLDGTDITMSAHARIPGLRDGEMGFTTFFDAAGAHPVLSALPTTDEIMTFLVPPMALGSPAACLNAKQIGYDPTRGNDGALMLKVAGEGNGYALEWGVQHTAGLRTDTAATVGTDIDGGGATDYGAQAYLQVTAFTGTDVTVSVEHCATSGGSYTNLITFSQVTAAPFAQRVAVSNTTAVDEFTKVKTVTSGGFSTVTFSVVWMRNLVAGVVF